MNDLVGVSGTAQPSRSCSLRRGFGRSRRGSQGAAQPFFAVGRRFACTSAASRRGFRGAAQPFRLERLRRVTACVAPRSLSTGTSRSRLPRCRATLSPHCRRLGSGPRAEDRGFQGTALPSRRFDDPGHEFRGACRSFQGAAQPSRQHADRPGEARLYPVATSKAPRSLLTALSRTLGGSCGVLSQFPGHCTAFFAGGSWSCGSTHG